VSEPPVINSATPSYNMVAEKAEKLLDHSSWFRQGFRSERLNLLSTLQLHQVQPQALYRADKFTEAVSTHAYWCSQQSAFMRRPIDDIDGVIVGPSSPRSSSSSSDGSGNGDNSRDENSSTIGNSNSSSINRGESNSNSPESESDGVS
jgi:hypothetical protein